MESREQSELADIRALSDEHYMLNALDLANWQQGNVPDHANLAWRHLTTDTSTWTLQWASYRLDPTIEVSPGALQFGEQARSALARFLTGKAAMLTALRATAAVAIDQVEVRTQLRISEAGALEHLHSYTAGTADGPLGLFLSFLLDPDRRFGHDLKRCRLPSCGRYFFVPTGRKGGRIPSYCPGTDHQRLHDAMRAPARAKKHRATSAKHK